MPFTAGKGCCQYASTASVFLKVRLLKTPMTRRTVFEEVRDLRCDGSVQISDADVGSWEFVE